MKLGINQLCCLKKVTVLYFEDPHGTNGSQLAQKKFKNGWMKNCGMYSEEKRYNLFIVHMDTGSFSSIIETDEERRSLRQLDKDCDNLVM